MIVEAVLAGVLVVVVIIAAVRLRATGQRAEAAEVERDRLKAEGEALRGQLAERDEPVQELTPFRGLVEGAGDYEQGHFPDGGEGDPIELAEAYLTALKWADSAGRWLA